MNISLIITTYNWQEALHLSLQSALSQTLLPLEIIVADDGSGPETAELVQKFGSSSPIPIHHSWQEDRGFRVARSRNKAIAMSRGAYLLLVDGDMVLEPHFIADHWRHAHTGFFVQGSRVLLSQHITAQLLTNGLTGISLESNCIGNRKNSLRSSLLARVFSTKSKRLPGIRSCNFAFWKEDALRVNGFDENFVGWGREDSEFAARLLNIGLSRRNLRFQAIGYHLHHPMNAREGLTANEKLLRRTIEEKRLRCDQGLHLHLQ